MTLTELAEKIPVMDDGELVRALHHDNFIVRTKAICEVVKRGIDTTEAIEAIRKLGKDSTVFWNQYKVKDFADAALELLGVQENVNKNEQVKRLVKSKLLFT